jgi:hypothetical protein
MELSLLSACTEDLSLRLSYANNVSLSATQHADTIFSNIFLIFPAEFVGVK